MHGTIFTTEQGEARSNLITWQDQRVLEAHPSGAGTYFDVLAARLNTEAVQQLGNELRPGLPIGLFFWLAEQGLLPAPTHIPAALSGFLVAALCGTRPETESTNAHAFGLFNLMEMDWHGPVIAALGLQRLALPAVRPHGAVTGWMDWHGRKIPIYTPIGDYQCALLGALLREGELSLNISTGSQVSLLRPTATFGNYQTRPFFDGRFAITITHIPAGRALNALVRLLSELAEGQGLTVPDPWAYISVAAARVPPPTLKANLAFYSSAAGDEGALWHLHEDELTVGHLFRAAFQNMAENYRAFAQRLSPEQDWARIVFSGGLVQKLDLLRTLICDQFGVAYRIAPAQEDSLLGLMALGLAFTGRAASVTDAVALLAQAYQVAAMDRLS
jgi:sugar (pentulose or hexulose) kinase